MPNKRQAGTALVLALALLGLAAGNPASGAEAARKDFVPHEMVLLPAGSYEPFFLRKAAKDSSPVPVAISSFWLDIYPVTNRDFLAFVRREPQWRKSRIKAVFADTHYLDRWPSDLALPHARDTESPVTNVSWFGAKAYCESLGKSLPTTDQWEYALADQGRGKAAITDQTLAWYSATNPARLPAVGTTGKNGFGLSDMVGLVWEWTLDFNSFMVGTELRDTDGKDKAMFCGSGSLGTKDAADYAAFMRYALRTSLKADYTTHNLGFRCAKEMP